MNHVLGVCFALLLFPGCTEPETSRYTKNSPEIETFREWIATYNLGDWEALRSFYSDTAKIWHNAIEPIRVEELLLGLQGTTNSCTSYHLGGLNQDYEMILTDDNETWVNYWGQWEGTISGSGTKVTMPVHVSSRFEGGKIVAEHAYYDMTNLSKALAEILSTPDTLRLEKEKE